MFLLHDQKIIVCKIRKILPRNPPKNFKKSIFSWQLSKFSKNIRHGVPLPPLQKNFIADLDELEHAKKRSCENVNIFGWPPPHQLWKFITFFFRMNPSLNLGSDWKCLLLAIRQILFKFNFQGQLNYGLRTGTMSVTSFGLFFTLSLLV